MRKEKSIIIEIRILRKDSLCDFTWGPDLNYFHPQDSENT